MDNSDIASRLVGCETACLMGDRGGALTGALMAALPQAPAAAATLEAARPQPNFIPSSPGSGM